MNKMDEITYWVYTKRAPCLFKYDYTVKKRNEEAHSSHTKDLNLNSFHEPKTPLPKKKKKKVTLFDDESLIEEPCNVFFDTSLQQRPIELKSYKSDSDINFNIKGSPNQTKNKKVALKKNGTITVNKRKGLVTSTPNVKSMLRRSSRTIHRSQHNNQQINSSFDVINCSLDNSNNLLGDSCLPVTAQDNTSGDVSKDIVQLASGDHVGSRHLVKIKKVTKFNSQFEDFSDVSGLTASYIRSTKLHANNNPRKLQPTKKLLESQQHLQTPDSKVIVCVNKSINTELRVNVLNCSDSDNIVNLVTVENSNKANKVDNSTSIDNFVDPKVYVKDAPKSDNKQGKNRYVSFNSKSSGNSRYQTRSKHASVGANCITPMRRSPRKSFINNSNDSDRKENPELCLTRTRSGRNLGLAVRPPDNSVLVNSNTEQDSSPELINVASSRINTLKNTPRQGKKKKSTSAKCSGEKLINKTKESIKDSLREKTGLTACFSDSEDEKPLLQQKFFC